MSFTSHLLSFINSQQNQVSYATPGISTFIVPEGVIMMSGVCIGGGGGGAGSDGIGITTFGTGGGGGGGVTWSVFGVEPGNILTTIVGNGGESGFNSNGGDGQPSSISISFSELWTWGYANSGQLGIAVTTGFRSTPVTTFAGGTNWKEVSSGNRHTAAIKTDGTLWIWGYGNSGRLGNATIITTFTPVTTFAGGTNWKQVSAGNGHTAAIKTDGTLWTWGYANTGQLGNAATPYVTTPVTTFSGGTNWKQVSSGYFHTAAIKTDGTLWTWGLGIQGQLGNATIITTSTPVTTFAGGTNWKEVTTGNFHTAAIKTDGTLWTWGYGTSGQLGNATIITTSTPVTTFSGGTNWKQVSGGTSHTAAIKTDGTLWTWGQGGNARLGNAVTTGNISTPVTTFAGGTNWKQVSSGLSNTAAIKSIEDVIIQGLGGQGGSKNASGTGGSGGIGNSANTTQTFCPIYLSGGGNGGVGGTSIAGSSGGGGAGGYRGDGGRGGSTSPNTTPTAAALNSGGGGGGGATPVSLGFGGGGVGAYGYPGTGQGSAGVNGTSGGGGGSFFNDPGLGLSASKVGETISIGTTINIPNDVLDGDFLLLLSGSDKDGGILELPIPVGFTTISKSYDGSYNTLTQNGIPLGITSTVPDNQVNGTESKDLNFASSYTFYAPGIGTEITGLSTSSIHNLIALRYIPNPVDVFAATTSGDPSINTPSATSMPNPPSISNVPQGAISIALGFLANTTLNPSNQIAGAGSTFIASAGLGTAPAAVGIVASYQYGLGTGTTVTPAPFLTGTSSHSRAYTIQVDRASVGTAVTVVGSAIDTGGGTLSLAGISRSTGDLIILVTAMDNPTEPGDINTPLLNSRSFSILDEGQEFDSRQTGNPGLSYQVASIGLGSTDLTSNITNIEPGQGPTASIAIVLRGASSTISAAGAYGNLAANVVNNGRTIQANFDVNSRNDGTSGDVLDGSTLSIGPPTPPSLTLNANNPLILNIGMIDDTQVSNVQYDPETGVGTLLAPTGYQLIAAQSYGEQNNGVIIMTGYRGNVPAGTEDPSAFSGAGANVWASQTIIIGGPGSQTGGTNLDAGLYGGGGASMSDSSNGIGMAGANGAARIIWGTARQYPSTNQGNAVEIDWTP